MGRMRGRGGIPHVLSLVLRLFLSSAPRASALEFPSHVSQPQAPPWEGTSFKVTPTLELTASQAH